MARVRRGDWGDYCHPFENTVKEKLKPLLFQIPVVLLASTAFYIHEQSTSGALDSAFVQNRVFPTLRRISSFFSDVKFRMRGSSPVKNKIVIVEIDSASLNQLGRWPWHRDLTAYLIDRTFEYGARVVGLDMIFPEADPRIPPELAENVQDKKWLNQFDSDAVLEKVIRKHSSRLVLAWQTESACRPVYDASEICPVSDASLIAMLPENFDKFSLTHDKHFVRSQTPIVSAPEIIANLPSYHKAATHSGSVYVPRDPDGVTRRTSLILMANGKPHPSLALEMARVALHENIHVSFNESNGIQNLFFAGHRRIIPVTASATAEINFRGGPQSFTYLSARDLLRDEDRILDETNRKLTGLSKKALLRDSIVLIGVTALAVGDLASTPFDSHVPGVEVQATILDNILSGHLLSSQRHYVIAMLILMVLGTLLLAHVAQKVDAISLLLLFLGSLTLVAFLDIQILFTNNQNWNTGFFYLELLGVMFITLTTRYVREEKNKKFLRTAFSKYVAPAVVDSLVRDPSRLSIGGEKKILTMLFADIRGFTTFSETMDAKKLTEFLNEYFGIMTEIVFTHGGTLDKYIGDALMAFWGAPLDQPDHAYRACEAARAMLEALRKNQTCFRERYNVAVNIGIGINSGLVSVGNMGSERSFGYTVIGDQVNLAARLETATKTYGTPIITSRFTLDEIRKSGKTLPPHSRLGEVNLRGKSQPVEIFSIATRAPTAILPLPTSCSDPKVGRKPLVRLTL